MDFRIRSKNDEVACVVNIIYYNKLTAFAAAAVTAVALQNVPQAGVMIFLIPKRKYTMINERQ